MFTNSKLQCVCSINWTDVYFNNIHQLMYILATYYTRGSSGGSEGKASVYNVGDWVWSLGQEDPLENKMSTHISILAWKIPLTEKPGGLQSLGSQRVGHNWATSLNNIKFWSWGWQMTAVFTDGLLMDFIVVTEQWQNSTSQRNTAEITLFWVTSKITEYPSIKLIQLLERGVLEILLELEMETLITAYLDFLNSKYLMWLKSMNRQFSVPCSEMGIPDHLTCLLKNLYAGQEGRIRTGHGTTDWFQIRKGVCQGCILSSCLFNLHAECIIRNAGLEEAQAGIKIARRTINNLRYADDTTLITQKVKSNKGPLNECERGEWKSWLKAQ